MNDFDENEKRLINLLKANPLEFMKDCFSNSKITGSFCPICKFVQLSILNKKEEALTNQEIQLLHHLNKRYNSIDLSHFIQSEKQAKRTPDLADFKKLFKDVSRDLNKTVQDKHEKNPLGGAAALLEYTKAVATNFKEERGIKYNYKNNRELFKCLSNFNGKKFEISKGLYIKLKPRGFIHILVGHLDKHLIPRKGKQVIFSKADSWEELLALIGRVINFLSTELIEHYRLNQSGFNKLFEFENCKYGIHLSKNLEIKTFYEQETTSANKA